MKTIHVQDDTLALLYELYVCVEAVDYQVRNLYDHEWDYSMTLSVTNLVRSMIFEFHPIDTVQIDACKVKGAMVGRITTHKGLADLLRRNLGKIRITIDGMTVSESHFEKA